MLETREYYLIRLDLNDIPQGILTGPFESVDQANTAAEALRPLFPQGERIVAVGGNAVDLFHRLYN